jgi:hypothetical protein
LCDCLRIDADTLVAWRSNSARTPNAWSTDRPAALVVSICSVNDRKPDIPTAELLEQAWQFRHPPAKPIQPAHHRCH